MGEDTKVIFKKIPNKQSFWSGIALIIGIVALMLFLYFDRNEQITGLVQSLGASGVIGAVLIMTIVCLTPLPSEGFLIMNLKVYGLFWGLLYSWLGFILGLVVVYYIAFFLGCKFISSWTSVDSRFKAIDTWVTKNGTGGLLVVRLLPIPAFLVNMLIGLLPSVSFWKYLWTGIVGIIPYYIGVSFIFLGFSNRTVYGFILGFLVLVIIWGIGLWERHK